MSQATISTEIGNSTERLASMAHETVGAATKVAGRAKALQEQTLESAEDNLRKVRSYAASNPLVTAAVAFAAGVLLSAVIRR